MAVCRPLQRHVIQRHLHGLARFAATGTMWSLIHTAVLGRPPPSEVFNRWISTSVTHASDPWT